MPRLKNAPTETSYLFHPISIFYPPSALPTLHLMIKPAQIYSRLLKTLTAANAHSTTAEINDTYQTLWRTAPAVERGKLS